MNTNGLNLSKEKTKLMFFNSGINNMTLPTFEIDNSIIQYQQSVKFLGVILTPKLQWNLYINHILTKVRKSLNFLKVVIHQSWGQNTKILLYLSTALIRSKITYGQEVYFSAPNHLLKKLESIDCKAYKLALGLPTHASNSQSYMAANVLPLAEYRQLASAKYLLRCNTIQTNIEPELQLCSKQDFPKRAKNISAQRTIKTYTSNVIKQSGIDLSKEAIAKRPFYCSVPSWELKRANFDINHTNIKKDENIHMLSCMTKEHIELNYKDHLKIYTDGSVMENKNVGAAFIIPHLNIERAFHLQKHCSIFTAELTAIIMALNFLIDFPRSIFRVLFCVDSKSVLQALQSTGTKIRSELIFEASVLINNLTSQGSDITFCWIPSHSNFYFNNKVDSVAKLGANNSTEATVLNIPLSFQECSSLIKSEIQKSVKNQSNQVDDLFIHVNNFCTAFAKPYGRKVNPRSIMTLRNRWNTNAFKTKFVKNVACVCKHIISREHIIHCKDMRPYLPELENLPFKDICRDPTLSFNFLRSLMISPLGSLL